MLKYHIQTIRATVGVVSTFTFSNIPQNYDDLLIVFSARSDRTSANVDTVRARFNASVTGYSYRALEGTGSGVSSFTSSSFNAGVCATDSCTSDTFGNSSLYIPSYTSNNQKSGSAEGVSESNATSASQFITASLWTGTSAINSIALAPETGSSFKIGSSASLYGIKRGSDGRTEIASGGTITTSGGYTVHTFNSSGTFIANRNLDVDVLIIAGGGGGGSSQGGGGGAGGYISQPLNLSAASYLVTVGSGGTGMSSSSSTDGSSGNNSIFTSLTAIGGGRGGNGGTNNALTGGSGGGGGAQTLASNGAAGTSGQGFSGGNGSGTFANAGGGGGASEAGNTDGARAGGDGVSSSITGTAVIRAGGGSGGSNNGASVAGGDGGGGAGTGTNSNGAAGTANTGGGGGGGGSTPGVGNGSGGAGGSGVAIIRYPTPA